MKKFKSRFIFILGLGALIVSMILILRLKEDFSSKPEQSIQEKMALDRLLKNSSEIQRIWWEGEDSSEWKINRELCLKKWKVKNVFDESLVRCNPMLIECIQEFDQKKKFKLAKISNEKYFEYISKTNVDSVFVKQNGYHFKLEDQETKKTLDILLESNCHEFYLDQRVYAYGEMPAKSEGDDFHFDNFNQHIYLDKSLVTNWEMNEWQKSKDRSELDPFLPATHISLNQMEKYCSYRGKHLMYAHYFDAATFLLSETFSRSPYYWTKKKNENIKDCRLIFSQECKQKETFKLNSISPSWAGLNDSMGGVMEAMRNPIEANLNLRVSSYYFPFSSKWHRLGVRTHWDGEGFKRRNIDFSKEEPESSNDDFDIGFRCMRESL
jgi:formylglycine-generating enzyme required for sulfatase activity